MFKITAVLRRNSLVDAPIDQISPSSSSSSSPRENYIPRPDYLTIWNQRDDCTQR